MATWPEVPAPMRAGVPQYPRLRSEAILDAARDLALTRDVRSVGLTSIARSVGITRTSLLRFFNSREQIFLELAARAWEEWSEAVAQALAVTSTSSREIAGAITGSLSERPLFCDLLAQAPLNLERNVSPEILYDYKARSTEASGVAEEAVVDALTGLGLFVTPDTGRALVAMIVAQAGMAWQISHPPQRLAQMYGEDARLAPAGLDFDTHMIQVVTLLIMGLGGD